MTPRTTTLVAVLVCSDVDPSRLVGALAVKQLR
jgi:hypothetical protein